MKKLVILLISLILITSFTYAQEIDENVINPDQILFDKIEKSTVSVLHVGKGIGTCTGVLVHEDSNYSYILSAKHCIGASGQEVKVEDNSVVLIITSPNDDLVYLVVSGKIYNKQPIELAEYDPYINDIIYHVGYPNWFSYRAKGRIMKKTKDWYFAAINVRPGCSGGGIYNIDGELIGIVWGGFGLAKDKEDIFNGLTPIPIAIFEPISDIKKFLNLINYEK